MMGQFLECRVSGLNQLQSLHYVCGKEWRGTALYLSVVTFTTLGYGDLAPRQEFRLVAASEALAGILL
jgi:voltage-gated potassium channel Kch